MINLTLDIRSYGGRWRTKNNWHDDFELQTSNDSQHESIHDLWFDNLSVIIPFILNYEPSFISRFLYKWISTSRLLFTFTIYFLFCSCNILAPHCTFIQSNLFKLYFNSIVLCPTFSTSTYTSTFQFEQMKLYSITIVSGVPIRWQRDWIRWRNRKGRCGRCRERGWRYQ